MYASSFCSILQILQYLNTCSYSFLILSFSRLTIVLLYSLSYQMFNQKERMTYYEKFDCRRFQLLFIAAVRLSDDDYDGFYVALYNCRRNFYLSPCRNRCAIISRKMGAGDFDSAREDFSFIILTGLIAGFLLMVIGNICLPAVRRISASSSN